MRGEIPESVCLEGVNFGPTTLKQLKDIRFRFIKSCSVLVQHASACSNSTVQASYRSLEHFHLIFYSCKPAVAEFVSVLV